MHKSLFWVLVISLGAGGVGCGDDDGAMDAASDTPGDVGGSAFQWSATITGLDGTDIILPAEGLAGTGVVRAGARLIGNNGGGEPEQIITITTEDAAAYGEVGESEVSVLFTWGDPQFQCLSNLENSLVATGATMNITTVGPASGTIEADLDCYLVSDPDPAANAVPAQVTAQFDVVGL